MTYQSTGVQRRLRFVIVGYCVLLLLLPPAVAAAASRCPGRCRCQQTPAVTVSCVSSNLTDLPKSLPVVMDTLDMSGNRLTALNGGLSAETVAMVTFNVSRNKIEVIASGAFRQFSSLTSIDLSDNRLSIIDEGTFDGGSRMSIHNLDLSSNRLTDVDGAFSGMVNLSRLDLRNNFITALTEFTLRDLTNLRYLFLSNNRIYTIDKRTFRSLPSLLYLVLKGNPLQEVTRFHFYAPSSLSYVDLSECSLSQLPSGLPQSIRYLQMRRNNLTSLSSGAFKECPDVNIVVLDENRIETIDEDSLSGLRRLQQLWLTENRLTQIPRSLPASLRRLLIDNNHVTRLESDIFANGSELNSLSLAGNKIQYVSRDALRRAVNLQSLDLSNNQIASLPSNLFSNNGKLRALQLMKNPLERLQADIFGNMSSLKVLSLSYVPSTSIKVPDDLLKPLSGLQRLDVDNSPSLAQGLVETHQFDQLASLQELGLFNSDLRSLPVNWAVLSRVSHLRLSSSRWHCDESSKWLRNWLLYPENSKKIDHGTQEIRCATPDSVQNKILVTLIDSQFEPTEDQPAVPRAVTSSAYFTTPTTQSVFGVDTMTTRVAAEGEIYSKPIGSYDDEDGENLDEEIVYDETEFVDSQRYDVITSSGADDSGEVTSAVSYTDLSIAAVASNGEADKDLDKLKVQILIAGSTIGATLLVITIIVAAIVYVCRHQRRPLANGSAPSPNGRTFIKYENKNGVLYFSTPADPKDGGATDADQRLIVSHVHTVADAKVADDSLQYLVPAVNTPSTPLTPASYKTRVYRWEDF